MNKTLTRLEAVDRVGAIADYLDTLLRAVWENLDVVGLVSREAAHISEKAAEDALLSLSLAQELVKELDGLGDSLGGAN
ncbi:MAG: hypothetical protein AB7E24_14735 [Novosphingobium sp.]